MFRPPEYAALISPMINAFAMMVAADGQVQGLSIEWCCALHELGPREWSPRAGVCVCGKPPWKCACKKKPSRLSSE